MIVCVKTTNPEAVAAHTTVAAQRWPHLLNELTDTVIDPHLARPETRATTRDRKSTRLNSSHVSISYAVFCLKKKKQHISRHTTKQTSTMISTAHESISS